MAWKSNWWWSQVPDATCFMADGEPDYGWWLNLCLRPPALKPPSPVCSLLSCVYFQLIVFPTVLYLSLYLPTVCSPLSYEYFQLIISSLYPLLIIGQGIFPFNFLKFPNIWGKIISFTHQSDQHQFDLVKIWCISGWDNSWYEKKSVHFGSGFVDCSCVLEVCMFLYDLVTKSCIWQGDPPRIVSSRLSWIWDTVCLTITSRQAH